MNELKYGNPPRLEDCVDLGTIPETAVPVKIGNVGIFAGNEQLRGLYGEEIPPMRRAWLAVAHFRDGVRAGEIPSPYTVLVPGLGRLVYQNSDPDFPQYGECDNFEILGVA